uniref:Adenylosuccinate synthetase n=1 Tax=Schistocephalus solidus TaxID=70667 RepID=A0A183SEP7_SCHSO
LAEKIIKNFSEPHRLVLCLSVMPTVQVVVGAQWGDEGKGKLVDMLSGDCDVVCRCQGGNNAGLLIVLATPSLWTVAPSFFTLCLAVLFEVDELTAMGIKDIENRMRISERSHIVFDFYQEVDEQTRGHRLLGTTKRGIGPAYASKVSRRGLRLVDLIGDWDLFCEKFKSLVEFYKHHPLSVFVSPIFIILASSTFLQLFFLPMVRDTVYLINKLAHGYNHKILIECAQSTMLDIDFGTFPYVTSSNCSVGGVCTGLGLAPSRVGDVYGVVKAYTTRVGSGAFPTELFGELAERLQSLGREFGVTTGRKRRVGWLDAVVVRYAHTINNFTALALTKLDILDNFDEIKIGKAYIDPETGATYPTLPSSPDTLEKVQVVYETFPGWKTDITKIREYKDLPSKVKMYIEAVERLCGVNVRWIGVGEGRSNIIIKSS